MKNYKIFLVPLIVAASLSVGNQTASAQSKYATMSDLPALRWAIDGFGGLRWGMTSQEVQSVLGPLTLYNADAGRQLEEYTLNASTVWAGARVNFGLPGVTFVQRKLCAVNFEASEGWEDQLLKELLSTFGPARYTFESVFLNGRGDLTPTPIARNAPHIVVGSEPNPNSISYQWIDAKTSVNVLDAWGWANPRRAWVRGVSVILADWPAVTKLWYGRPSEEAVDYLQWANAH